MEPPNNFTIQFPELQSSSIQFTNRLPSSVPQRDMPAPPPAYHLVVDSGAPPPHGQGLYEHEEDHGKDDEDFLEVTVNAATQIRGHGNIISITQMDNERIANLITAALSGGTIPDIAYSASSHEGPTLPSISRMTKGAKREPLKIHVTVNCGAAVIGDRNVIGPGLGNIARQMELAQRNRALLAEQQQQQQRWQEQQQEQQQEVQTRHHISLNAAQGLLDLHASAPSMSRGAAIHNDAPGGMKRKAEDNSRPTVLKRQC